MSMITVARAKELLNIPSSNTDYDTKIQNLIPSIQDWVIEFCNNDFAVEVKYPQEYYDNRFRKNEPNIFIFANSISFVNSTRSILDSDSNFIAAGFKPNFSLKVEETQYNDGVYKISSVSEGQIILTTDAVLTDEDSGYWTKITLLKFPKGLEIPVAKIIGEELKNDSVTNGDRIQSERVGNTNFSYGTKMSGEYPKEIMKQFKPWKRVRFV